MDVHAFRSLHHLELNAGCAGSPDILQNIHIHPLYDRLVSNGVQWCPMVSSGFHVPLTPFDCGILLVSRQRLLDRDLLSDATPLSQLLPAQLQLVLLEFLPSDRERDQEFLAACAENRVEPWLFEISVFSWDSWFFILRFC